MPIAISKDGGNEEVGKEKLDKQVLGPLRLDARV
jgi:hypothetical protein